jgi:hypothetical protein
MIMWLSKERGGAKRQEYNKDIIIKKSAEREGR